MAQREEASGGFGVSLSVRWVRGLGVLMIAVGLALPGVVWWKGWLRGDMPEVPVVDPTEPPVTVRPVMVGLPQGQFSMGSPEGEAGRDPDETQHLVTIEVDGFEICQTEVTQGQWMAVMGGPNPSYCDDKACGDKFPVNQVSWLDAVEYLNRLTELENAAFPEEAMSLCYTREGQTVTWEQGCTGYRLPTEAEWEYAARAGSRTAYHFGDDASELGEYAWYEENSGGRAHEVGTRKPNGWLLHDMHGNMLEWVWDWYGEYEEGSMDKNPTGPTDEKAKEVEVAKIDGDGNPVFVDGELQTEQGKARVLRGGSAWFRAWFLRSAYRFRYRPGLRVRSLGFRCARGAPQR